MNILNKLLLKEVQVKSTSEINVKEFQKKLKKQGINCSIAEIERYIEAYKEALEERRVNKLNLVAFFSTIAILLCMALETELRTMNIFVLSDIKHILLTITGLFSIGILWLRRQLLIGKKIKISRIVSISALVIVLGLIIAMFIV